jgi:hypothetical protein
MADIPAAEQHMDPRSVVRRTIAAAGPRAPSHDRLDLIVASGFARPEARRHGARGLRGKAAREELGARVVQHRGDLVLVIATLAARKARRAGPGGLCVRRIERHVAARCEIRHRHLAPRRDRLAGLGVRHGACGARQLRAVDALLERRPVRFEKLQAELRHSTSVVVGDPRRKRRSASYTPDPLVERLPRSLAGGGVVPPGR